MTAGKHIQNKNLKELAQLFFKLGIIGFGGPAAHIAMMQKEVVHKRKWMSEQHFLDLIGATNLIPGPNSTEMAIHIGHERAGWRGLIVAAGEPNAWYSINLVPSIYWSQGNASITGIINWGGAFKSGGTPAANIEIALFSSTGAPIAYTFSNNDGTFEFNNLPYGEFSLHAEMTGKITETVVVNLSENSTAANINFVVTAAIITATGSDNLDTLKLVAGNLYPNPVGEVLYLELNASSSGTALVEVIDLQGRIIRSESQEMSGGSSRISIATGDLMKGMYLLRVNTEGCDPVQRRFIK